MIDLPKCRGEYRFNFNLSALTWFKVGGCAEVFFKPLDEEDLAFFLANLKEDVPVWVLGAGSNTIIRDGGIDGVVVKLGRGFGQISHKEISHEKISHESRIYAGAGTLNYNLAQYAMQNNLSGLEFLVGIPGSVGGGVAMNAGSYGSEFKDILESVTLLDRKGQKHILKPEDLGFGYRHNSLDFWAIFTEVAFKAPPGNEAEIKAKMNEITAKRQETQPINKKTGGSTFANPPSKQKENQTEHTTEPLRAWQLIDQVGLRGARIGGAEFSTLHCNFMINNGNASARDLEELGELARKKVLEEKGIDLKWEIKRVGKFLDN